MSDAPRRRTTVLYELWRASRRSASVLEDALADAPLSGTDFGLYSLLRFSGPLTPTEVARRSGMPATTTSQVLKRLEERGHVQRAPNPDDARSVTVELTEAGVEVHARTGARFQPLLGSLYDDLGDEIDQIIYGLARLDRALATLAGDEPDDFSPMPPRDDAAATNTLTYGGPVLSVSEEDEVRRFIGWLRFRRTAGQSNSAA